jgi:hypothetical protein
MVQQRDLDDTAQRQTSSRVRVNFQAYKKELTGIQLSIQERTAHLPKLIADVTFRLRISARQGSIPRSRHANTVNCDVNSGYTVPMLVEDSRILEACIFSILHKSR